MKLEIQWLRRIDGTQASSASWVRIWKSSLLLPYLLRQQSDDLLVLQIPCYVDCSSSTWEALVSKKGKPWSLVWIFTCLRGWLQWTVAGSQQLLDKPLVVLIHGHMYWAPTLQQKSLFVGKKMFSSSVWFWTLKVHTILWALQATLAAEQDLIIWKGCHPSAKFMHSEYDFI